MDSSNSPQAEAQVGVSLTLMQMPDSRLLSFNPLMGSQWYKHCSVYQSKGDLYLLNLYNNLTSPKRARLKWLASCLTQGAPGWLCCIYPLQVAAKQPEHCLWCKDWLKDIGCWRVLTARRHVDMVLIVNAVVE